MVEKVGSMGLLEMAICTVCGTAVGLTAVAAILFAAISLFSGTTVTSVAEILFGIGT